MHNEFTYISINNLQPGQYQPRKDFNQAALEELSRSIASQGLIEPLVVRPIAKNQYEIIAGERRWRAAKLAGLEKVPCLIGSYTDKQACALTLIENIQRQDLNLIEEATGYRRLIDEFHYQQDEIALLVGKSRSHIANILRLLSLCELIKQYIREQNLSLGHARLLVGLAPSVQEFFGQNAIEKQWSVRQLEQEIKSYKSQELSSIKDFKKDRDVARLESLLSEQLGAPVQIMNQEKEGGWLQIQFFNNDTLAGLLEKFGLRYD